MLRLSNFFHYFSKRLFKYLKLWVRGMGHDPGQNYFPVAEASGLNAARKKAPVVLTHAVHFKVYRFKYRAISTFEIVSVQSVCVMPISFREGIFIS